MRAPGTFLFLGRVITVAAIALFAVAAPALAWQVEIDSEYGESRNDEAFGVAFDSRGDVIAIGHEDWDDWLVVKLGGGSGTELWRTVISGKTSGTEVADGMVIDGSDDVVAVGRFGGTGHSDSGFGAIKLKGTTGEELWRYTLDGSAIDSRDSAVAAAVDAAGDVFVVGTLHNEISDRDAVVVKLSGSDGTEVWKRVFTGSAIGGWDYGFRVAVDSSGNAIAAGRVANAATNTDPLVVKLAAADGATLWRTEIARTGSEYAQALLVDAAGDVFMAGDLDDGVSGEFALVKLAGSDGAVVWEQDLCCAGDRGRVESLALTPKGNVVAGGWAERRDFSAALNVAEFDGITGSTEWRIVLPGPHGYGVAQSVAVDAGGQVLVSGRIETSEDGNTDGILVKIRPCEPDEDDEDCEDASPSYKARISWQKRFNGPATKDDDYDSLYGVDVDPDGQVVAAGVKWNRNPVYPEENQSDFFVTMRAEDGSSVGGPDPYRPGCADGIDNDGDGLVDFGGDPGCADADDMFEISTASVPLMCTGQQVLTKDRDEKARTRSLAFRSKDALLTPPVGGTVGDPRTNGAVLELRNPITGEHAYTNLVADGWSAVGNPPDGSKGYKYRSRSPEHGPCKSVKFSPGKLTARCKGLGLRFTLDEASQGAVAVRLHLADGTRICTEFGGVVTHDESSSESRRTVKFRAVKSPAPASCDEP